MVDTKDQSNAIVYCVCYVVCRQCRHTQKKLLGWLLKESYGQKCVDMFCIDSVDIDCIECIRDPCPVLTVLTYIVYSNAIVYCVWYLVCRHCGYEDQSMQCIECYVCRDCRYTVVYGSYTTPYREYYEL